MFPIKASTLVGIVCLASASFGQVGQVQTRDRALREAQDDIALLKRTVREQDRRIAELEKLVKTLQVAAQRNAEPPPAPPTPPPKTAGKFRIPVPWHAPLAWAQIKTGMSRAQVEDLLGPPTSVDSVIDYQTLVYKGDVPEAGELSGSVRLTDDRVSQVDPPAF